jgi:signal peptide peptidase SppA
VNRAALVSSGPWLLHPDRLQVLSELGADQMQALAAAGAGRNVSPGYVVAGGVATITIRGVMLRPVGLIEQLLCALFGGVSTPDVEAAVRKMGADPDVREGRLVIDSPGGQADGVFELAAAVRDVGQSKPITAFVQYAASGAYWVASAARSIVAASPMVEVGSIGCYAVFVDESGAAAAAGAKVHVVSSSPPLKGAGVPGTEITGPQLEAWKRRVDDMAAVFVAEVAKGRGVAVAKVQIWATGEVWIASKALALGLVDQVGAEGGGGAVAKSAYDEARERAQVLMTSGRAKTFSAALELAWSQDPKLWERYEQERAEAPAPPPAPVPPPTPAPAAAYATACARAQELERSGRAKTFAAALELVWSQDAGLWARYMEERGEGPAAA